MWSSAVCSKKKVPTVVTIQLEKNMNRIVLLLTIACHLPAYSISVELRNPKSFLQQCLRIKEQLYDQDLRAPVAVAQSALANGGKCNDFKCFSRDESRDLRHLKNLGCLADNDCLHDVSAMICRRFKTKLQADRSYCDCPNDHAYNPKTCKCEPAGACGTNVRRF